MARFQVGSFILATLIVLTASVEYVVLLLSSPFLHEYGKLVVLRDVFSVILILCHPVYMGTYTPMW